MRSWTEIQFRLRQEAANLRYLLAAPRLRKTVGKVMPPLQIAPGVLPEAQAVAAALRGTSYAAEVDALAREIIQHRFPLFGGSLDTGREIHWNRDYRHGIEYPTVWFRRIPYLDFSRVGDHKAIWELNRHQHLVLLAQAWRLTGRMVYLNEIAAELEHWMDRNPYGRGMQWTSALEAAFRVLSWIWTWHLVAEALPEPLQARWAEALYQHGVHLRQNLSVYFSPNTHLLGEAVALHALGRLFPALPGAAVWRAEGGRIVAAEIEKQVRDDGSHFEQSSYYHVYAVDFFLFHALIEETTPVYRQRLARMADYLWTLLGPTGRIPFFGDDDGGRLFHPYGERDGFGRATLAACALYLNRTKWPAPALDRPELAAWWLGVSALEGDDAPWQAAAGARCFADAGMVSFLRGRRQVLVDTRAFGAGGAGHSHASALSLVCRDGAQEILIDPGTFTYSSDPAARDMFRGTAVHNTVRLGSLDQADPAGPFRWHNKPVSTIHGWGEDWLEASCVQRGRRHLRRVDWIGDEIRVRDEAEGGGEVCWHTALPVTETAPGVFGLGDAACLHVEGGRIEAAWRSRVHGGREPSAVIRAPVRDGQPLETRIVFTA